MSIKEKYKQFGNQLFIRIFKSVLRKVGIHRENFYLLKCAINNSDIQSKMVKFNYEDVIELELADFQESPFFNIEKLQLYKNRFDSGNYSCYGIIENGELIYSTWISWKYMNYPTFFNTTSPLNENEALLEDSFCHPVHRGRGLHSKMNVYRLKKIGEKGKHYALALVLKENTPALKVQLKSGFSIVSRISYQKNWGKVTIKTRNWNA